MITKIQENGGILGHFSWDGELLRRKVKLVVSDDKFLREDILKIFHDSPQGGHSGIQATYQRIKSLFWWKHLIDDITEFVKKCDTCARCKYEAVASLGMLQPLPIAGRVWESITMDFIEGLPKSNG